VNAVRIGKTKWSQEISDWLTTQLETGKYGFNRETLEPDYEYFEYLFIDAEDATAFSLTFSNTIYEYRIYRN
jgi:hypothetical protein